jgi:hypothetical protein
LIDGILVRRLVVQSEPGTSIPKACENKPLDTNIIGRFFARDNSTTPQRNASPSGRVSETEKAE